MGKFCRSVDGMNDEEKLSRAFEEVIWMAIRYAHGRSTFAPSMVRNAIKLFQEVHPDWKPGSDIVIKAPEKIDGISQKEDYLQDLVKN